MQNASAVISGSSIAAFFFFKNALACAEVCGRAGAMWPGFFCAGRRLALLVVGLRSGRLWVDIFEDIELLDLKDLIEASDFIRIIIRDLYQIHSTYKLTHKTAKKPNDNFIEPNHEITPSEKFSHYELPTIAGATLCIRVSTRKLPSSKTQPTCLCLPEYSFRRFFAKRIWPKNAFVFSTIALFGWL